MYDVTIIHVDGMLHRVETGEDESTYDYAELCENIPMDGMVFIRNRSRWRTPVFHLSFERFYRVAHSIERDPRYVQEEQDWDQAHTGLFYRAACGTDHKEPTVCEQLPDGCEICQRCAERYLFEKRRTAEQTFPDRAAYNEYTMMLLRRAGITTTKEE